MQFRKLILLLALIGLSVTVDAQNGKNIVSLGKGKAFYSGLSAQIKANIDTLSNLSVSGTMYVRFSIGTKGITEVSCSSSAPEVLKKVVTDALIRTDRRIFAKNATDGSYYVLPVEYDFLNSGQPGSLSQLMGKVPEVSLDNAQKDVNAEFASLFGISEDGSGNLYGVRCILLQVVKIRGRVQ